MGNQVSDPTIPLVVAPSSNSTGPDGSINSGDTAWMLTSTALVLLMTPGLAFFYGGLAQSKNIINTLLLSYVCMGVVIIQWLLFGYGFAFAPGTPAFGSLGWGAINPIGPGAHHFYSPTYPQIVHVMYQGAFAVITPALISGAVVGRMKFSAYLIFIVLWATFVYDAVAHWVWSEFGFFHVWGTVDFAGGIVVHLTAGVSALVAAVILGPAAKDEKTTDEKALTVSIAGHRESIPFAFLGTGLLWFGWMGFNAGSANAANYQAGVAFLNSNAAAATSMMTWMALDSIARSATLTGGSIGAVAGLAVITPCAGFVRPGWALLIGVIAALFCWGACEIRHRYFQTKIDDTLDVFGCHGVGGFIGPILLGCFAEEQFGGVNGAFFGHPMQLWYEFAAVVLVGVYCAVATAVILLLLKYTIGIRVSDDAQRQGLDQRIHHEMFEYGAVPFHHTARQAVAELKAKRDSTMGASPVAVISDHVGVLDNSNERKPQTEMA